MAVVPLTCPRCAGLIEIDASRAGKQVVCPACYGLISVPPLELLAPPPVAPPPIAPEVEPPPVELTPLTCPECGGQFQVATTLAGSRVACPNCNQLVIAPPHTAVEPAPPPLPSREPPEPQPPASAAAKPPPPELSPKQRSQRRHTRNLILWIVCLVILVAVCWLLR